MCAIAWHTFQSRLKTRSPVTQELFGGRDGRAVDQELGTSWHYSGEGNASRRVATAERMREGLHYKNKRSLAFSIFLDRMQKMFNIYEEEGEEFTENAKLRELFKRVQHPQLQDTVKALKFTLTWKVSRTPRQQITLLPQSPSSQSTTSLARFQPRHLEHQRLKAVTIAILRKKGECKPRTKA